MSLRTVRSPTSSRAARSVAAHVRGVWSSPSRASRRPEVSSTIPPSTGTNRAGTGSSVATMTSTQTLAVRPFEIAIPQADLDDLQHRLEITRFPEPAPGDDWSYGTPVGYLRGMVEHWLTAFDWRAQEARMNEVPHFLTKIDGQTVHFLHVRSTVEDAT